MRETPTEFKKCDVNKMIHSSLEVIKIPDDVRVEISENYGFVNRDESKTKSVFTNMIYNAVQAVGDKGEINIGIDEEENNLIISIRDSGKGIYPMKILRRYLSHYLRLKKANTGLGLANRRQILENQDAIIAVKNNPTTFTIKFPKFSE